MNDWIEHMNNWNNRRTPVRFSQFRYHDIVPLVIGFVWLMPILYNDVVIGDVKISCPDGFAYRVYTPFAFSSNM